MWLQKQLQTLLWVAGWTMHAKNARRYVKSRTPSDLRPVTPSLATPSRGLVLVSLWDSTEVPGVLNADVSGTTINVPVKIHLSPAFALSTSSPRTITSKLYSQINDQSPVIIDWSYSKLRSRHTASRNFVCILLDTDLLPIDKMGLLNIQCPMLSVKALKTSAHGRLQKRW